MSITRVLVDIAVRRGWNERALKHSDMAIRSKRKVVIVGSGLAGSIVASSLSDDYDVVVIEASASSSVSGPILRDAGYPSNSEFFCGFGPGGSTAFWHNGLIEPPRQVFDSFPPGWDRLAGYINRAHRLLSGIEIDAVRASAQKLVSRLEEKGFQRSNLGSPLYYPNQRINAWYRLVQGTVPLIIGNVIEFVSKERGRAHGVRIATDNGEALVEGDIFVLSAGGLNSPVILAELHLGPETNLKMAGLQYEDHPMGFVGSVELTEDIAGL